MGLPAYAPSRRVEVRLVAAPLLGLLVLAAAGFAFEVTRSSLFIDEVYSWRTSHGSLGQLADGLRYGEITPPLYYLFLHGWMQVTSAESELALRLPSVLAGVGLVAAVNWLGSLVAGRRAGLIAAGLAAISPLVLVYAQQVRAYIFVMLALTLAVAAAVKATQERSSRWLLIAGLAASISALLHYTSLLVLAPLAIWLWRRSELPVRWRAGFAAAIALPLAALAPLAAEQLSQGHHSSAATYASLTMFNAVRLAGTPFDGRATGGPMLVRELGAVIVVEALALLALGDRFKTVPLRRLIVACAAVPLMAVLVLSAFQQPLALTRYTAVAAPFVLVAIATVAVRLQREAAVLLLTAALIVSGLGIAAASRQTGQNPDTRSALQTVADNWHDGDTVAGVALLGFDGALSYYGDRLLPSDAGEVRAYRTLADAVAAPSVSTAALSHRRVWLLSDPVLSRDQLRRELGAVDLRPVYDRVFSGNAPVQVVRAERIE